VGHNDEVERTLESGTPVTPGLAARWFQALYETPLLFSGILDAEGRVLDANALSIEGCGLDRREIIGTRFWECGWWNRDPQLADRIRTWCEQALASGEAFRAQSEYYLGDGTRRMVDLALSPLVDKGPDGEIRYLVATGSDITDAFEAQAERVAQVAEEADEFRRAQELFRSGLDAMVDPVAIGRAVRDDDGTIVDYEISFVNQASVEGEGPSADELVGRRLCEIFPSWRTSEMWDRFLEVVETGEPYIAERIPYEDVQRDGTRVSGYWDLRVAKLGDGYITVSRDVTALLRAEESAREAERFAERERAAVDLLQRAALPDALPVTDRVSIGAHYQPAAEQPIGGDWYDAFLLDDAHLALVIADVAGHGAEAASYMVQLRNVLRTVAVDNSQPDEILRRVNRIACTLHASEAPMTTCCVALLDLEGLRLSFAIAGHLPPLVRALDGRRDLPDASPGPPIGVSPDATYAAAEVELQPGDRLVMYTDGLIERRGESLAVGIERLARSVDDRRDLAPQACTEFLSADLSPRDDDVALLLVEIWDEDEA
jgi:PAS domain S-box-containing protein